MQPASMGGDVQSFYCPSCRCAFAPCALSGRTCLPAHCTLLAWQHFASVAIFECAAPLAARQASPEGRDAPDVSKRLLPSIPPTCSPIHFWLVFMFPPTAVCCVKAGQQISCLSAGVQCAQGSVLNAAKFCFPGGNCNTGSPTVLLKDCNDHVPVRQCAVPTGTYSSLQVVFSVRFRFSYVRAVEHHHAHLAGERVWLRHMHVSERFVLAQNLIPTRLLPVFARADSTRSGAQANTRTHTPTRLNRE